MRQIPKVLSMSVVNADNTVTTFVPAQDLEMCDGTWIDGGRELAVTAAREALAPIRELHAKNTEPCADCSKLCSVCASECVTCETPWPCDTARLCYTTDELETP